MPGGDRKEIHHGLLHGRNRAHGVAPEDPRAHRAVEPPRAGATEGYGGSDAAAVTDPSANASPMPLLALRSNTILRLDPTPVALSCRGPATLSAAGRRARIVRSCDANRRADSSRRAKRPEALCPARMLADPA